MQPGRGKLFLFMFLVEGGPLAQRIVSETLPQESICLP